MSLSIIRFIPTEPSWSPDAETRQRAHDFIASAMPKAESVQVQTHDEIVFVDAGENAERIVCPLTKQKIDEVWWSNTVEAVYEKNQFQDLTVFVPCCGARISLNDLDYQPSQGFARFVIEVTEPEISKVNESVKQQLELILGKRMRVIYARY